MVSTRCQLPALDHFANKMELKGIVPKQRVRATSFREVIVYENDRDSEGGILRSGYRVHRRVPTETVRGKNFIRVLTSRSRRVAKIVGRNRFARAPR